MTVQQAADQKDRVKEQRPACNEWVIRVGFLAAGIVIGVAVSRFSLSSVTTIEGSDSQGVTWAALAAWRTTYWNLLSDPRQANIQKADATENLPTSLDPAASPAASGVAEQLPHGSVSGLDGAKVRADDHVVEPRKRQEDKKRASTRRFVPNYGWKPYAPERLSPLISSRNGERDFCDLPSFAANEVPEEVYDRGWAQRPFILREDADLLAQREAFGRDRLLALSKRRKAITRVGYSWDIVMNKGEGPSEVPLKKYIEQVMNRSWYDEDTRLEYAYSFDRHSVLSNEVAFKVPPPVHAWNSTAFTPRTAKPIVLLGGPESGVGFHRHEDALHLALHGWKRWLFYPPTDNPFGGVHGAWPILDWLRFVYTGLRRDQLPLECVQGPGDIVYVPEGWYHAVINLADSVAVSLQRNAVMSEFMKLEYSAKLAKDITTQVPKLNRLTKLQPGNVEARYQLFQATQRTSPAKAARVAVNALDDDPFFVDLQYAYANHLADGQREGNTDTLPILRRHLSRWKPYLENNSRNLMANHMLAQHYMLSGDRTRGTAYLERNARLQALGITGSQSPDFSSLLHQLRQDL